MTPFLRRNLGRSELRRRLSLIGGRRGQHGEVALLLPHSCRRSVAESIARENHMA